MDGQIILLSLILVPVIGSFILPLFGKISKNFRNVFALLFVLSSLVGSCLLLPIVMNGEIITVSSQYLPGLGLFYADKLAVFMSIIASLVSSIIVLYSFGYINHYEHQNEYYFMVVLFLGSMMGLVYSSNLISIYLFWEITAIACWRLIGFFREKEYILRADKAFLITVFAALVMLIGFIYIYNQTGSFNLLDIKNSSYNAPISNIAVILILVGLFAKSATLPLHTWLPDAGVAPSPVTALLHAAVLVKIGVYVFARLFVATFNIDPVWHTVIPFIVGISSLISAGAALIEKDIKRIIAYSTVSQLGFIFLGLAVDSEIGIAGGLLYILMHSIAKGGLFLCAGIVEQKTHIKDITKLGGLIKTMPITAFSFLFCAFSVMGIPPFGGFFSKFMVINGAARNGNIWISSMFIIGACLTILYLLRVFNLVFLGEAKHSEYKEGSKIMLVSVIILALLSLLSGIFINYPSEFVNSTVQQMLGVIK